MPIRSDAWEQVGENFEALGEHLRAHFDTVATDAAAERAAFEKTVRGLLAALEDGFGAARKVVRDPVLREDVTTVATSVREALLSSFETGSGQLRERLSGPRRLMRPPTKRAPAARKTAARKAAAKPTAKRAAPAKRAAG